MKKLLSILLALAMVLSLVACSGSQGSKDQTNDTPSTNTDTGTSSAAPTDQGKDEVELPPYKIAVAFTQINATALAQQKYLENYVGPAFNVKFMFSEAIDSAEAAMTFIENAYAAGCQAIMNFQNSSVEQINAKANELGMYIINNAMPVENSDLPYVLGYMTVSIEEISEMYRKIVEELTSDGEKHNVVIVSAGAGLGNEHHYQYTYTMLDALQKAYNLTYSDTIENLAASRGMVELETGSDVKILLYPGYPNSDTYVSGLSAMLQTGEYDIVLGCNQATAKFSVAIDEVERAYGMNIKVVYFSSVDDATTAGFNTIDSAGDTSINSVLIQPGNLLVGGMFAVLYNGISGHADVIREDGSGHYFGAPIWEAPNAEAYAAIATLDGTNGNHELSIEEIQQMLAVYNPDVSIQSIQDALNEMSSENVLAARGLK